MRGLLGVKFDREAPSVGRQLTLDSFLGVRVPATEAVGHSGSWWAALLDHLVGG
jgi:hypothetical protein